MAGPSKIEHDGHRQREVKCGRVSTEHIVADDRRVRDLTENDCRTRLAESCGTRNEIPSSNLGRGNPSRRQESTSRRQRPTLGVKSPPASQRTSTESDDAEQEGSCGHGVPWEHRAQTA